MANMKTKYLSRLPLVISFLLIHGCCLENPDTYEQLSTDDLKHLYFNRDSVICEEEDIEFTDSVTFLLNSRDTITVAAKTKIWTTIDEPLHLGNFDANGQSTIMFEKKTGFEFIQVSVYRSLDWQYPSKKKYRVSLVNSDQVIIFSRIVDELINGVFPLDTASVLNLVYNQVYKYDLSKEGNESNIKSVYFAKKYGFIKIEGHDGSKLELIEVKSKGMKEHETKNPASTPRVGLEEKNKEVGN
jgi:hypothetical protein